MPQPPIATEKLDAIGLDAICESIAQGKSMTAIAFEAGVSIGSFLNWISADGERSARVREIRIKMALHWDERAEAAIAHAGDEFELKKAREIAHHYRWRAAKIAPRDYGDKLEIAGDAKAPITVHIVKLTDGGQ